MRVFFSVGEPSGDQHAARLIEEIRRRRPEVECEGFGGPSMREAGCRVHFQLTDLAVMGLFRVLPKLGEFYRVAKKAQRLFREDPPDLVVLIDFPGFNWHIAKAARRAGIPVYYYMPPQLWAWGAWRIRRMHKYVDRVLCGLEFERDWYTQRGVAAEFVGHPFFDEVAESRLDEAFVAEARRRGPVLGVLPGSRKHEVADCWPILQETIVHVSRAIPDVRFLVACYKDDHRRRCEERLRASGIEAAVEFHVGKTPEIIEAADACLMVSGSVSLQMLARRTPAAVLYRLSPWTYPGFKAIVDVPWISLPNLMAGQEILPERLVVAHPKRDAEAIADRLIGWFREPEQLAEVRNQLSELSHRAAQPGGLSRVADAILETPPVPVGRRAA